MICGMNFRKGIQNMQTKYNFILVMLEIFSLLGMQCQGLGGIVGGFIYWVCEKGKNNKHGMS